jgi:hypothetical protein
MNIRISISTDELSYYPAHEKPCIQASFCESVAQTDKVGTVLRITSTQNTCVLQHGIAGSECPVVPTGGRQKV